MRRLVAVGMVLSLVILPTPARAAPTCDETGLTCLEVVDGRAVVTGPAGLNLSVPVPTQVIETPGPTVTVAVPGPTSTVTVTPPARTVTITPSPVTVTAAPTTVTETATVTRERVRNATTRQETEPSDIVEPTLAAPPVQAGIDLIPDTPGAAAATFSILGLIVGMALGVLALYLVHRRARQTGRVEGEEEANAEFRDAISDHPTEELSVVHGKHRAN